VDYHLEVNTRTWNALCGIVVAIVVFIACPVGATSIFTADLTGSQETPLNASPASGFGTFVLKRP
jgi:hypothetical protein